MSEHTKYHKALFWEQKGKDIQCLLCPHRCILSEGQTGLCMVRSHINGELISSVYGFPAALGIDPIEKKPLYHFLPGSRALSLGTQGCNLKCRFCQNWHLSTRAGHRSAEKTPSEIVEEARRSSCGSIAFTYNEPIVFAEYAMDIRDIAIEAGIPCIMVTNGYITAEAREAVFTGISAVNIDLKAFSDDVYVNYTGGGLQSVLDTIEWCIDRGIHTELTTLLIPGVNDDPKMIRKECQWIKKQCGEDTVLHISAFHPDYKMKDFPATSRALLVRSHDIAKDSGLNYVYIGNYPGFDNNTYCPVCGEPVIKRDYYNIEAVASHRHQLPIIWSRS